MSQTNIKLNHDKLKSACKFQNDQSPVSKFNPCESASVSKFNNSAVSQKFNQLFSKNNLIKHFSSLSTKDPHHNSLNQTINDGVRHPFYPKVGLYKGRSQISCTSGLKKEDPNLIRPINYHTGSFQKIAGLKNSGFNQSGASLCEDLNIGKGEISPLDYKNVTSTWK
jgi:hypothetical protein